MGGTDPPDVEPEGPDHQGQTGDRVQTGDRALDAERELFLRAYAGHEREFLEDLVTHGQHPLAFFLGCSDSRVIPELLTRAVPGELFVVRNVSNQLPPIGRHSVSAGAALEYAVGHLKGRHLIVCGHDLCGGVRAALDGGVDRDAYPALADWLDGLATVVERTRSVPEEGGRRWQRTVEANVLEQLNNALGYPAVARAVEAEQLAFHGWVFDLASGALRVYHGGAEGFVSAVSLLEAG